MSNWRETNTKGKFATIIETSKRDNKVGTKERGEATIGTQIINNIYHFGFRKMIASISYLYIVKIIYIYIDRGYHANLDE